MLATEQDTEIHILGSGALTFSWWQMTHQSWGEDVGERDVYDAPDGWSMVIEATDPEDEDGMPITATITHDKLIDAMRDIVDGRVKGFGTACESECGNFLADPEGADFDAGTADEVLQIAIYGEVIYS